MKHLLFTLLLLATSAAVAQDPDKTVTLKTSGSGTTQEQAKNNALRSAVEQAYGAFISSKTEILNDQVVADEIVSVASGNIQAFKILEEQHTDSLDFCLLEAVVSISKLTSFAQSKGYAVEVKGGLFALNIKQKQLNESAEVVAIKNSLVSVLAILENGFDFNILTKEPVVADAEKNTWQIEAGVFSKTNDNYIQSHKMIFSLLKNIGMSAEEVEEYKSLGKQTYEINYKKTSEQDIAKFYLRSSEGFWVFVRLAFKIPAITQGYQLFDGVKKFGDGIAWDFEEFSKVSYVPQLGEMIDQFRSNLDYRRSELLSDKSFPHFGDKYFNFAPVICANMLNYVELTTEVEVAAFSKFTLVYSLEELEKVMEIKVQTIQKSENRISYDFSPYIHTGSTTEHAGWRELEIQRQTVYRNKHILSASIEEIQTPALAEHVNNFIKKRSKPIEPIEGVQVNGRMQGYISNTLMDSCEKLVNSNLPKGYYKIHFSYVSEMNGRVSNTSINKVWYRSKEWLLKEWLDNGYFNESELEKYSDESNIKKISDFIKNESSKITTHRVETFDGGIHKCNGVKVRKYHRGFFTLYIN